MNPLTQLQTFPIWTEFSGQVYIHNKLLVIVAPACKYPVEHWQLFLAATTAELAGQQTFPILATTELPPVGQTQLYVSVPDEFVIVGTNPKLQTQD